jgi:CHAD domain-containing protein
MAFRLKLRKSLPKELQRVLIEEIDACSIRLATSKPPEAGVHDIRKGLKRLRAALRLAEPALGKRLSRHERRRLRDLARLLSVSREAEVMRETLSKLQRDCGLRDDGPTAQLQSILAAQAPPTVEASTFARVGRGLAEARRNIERADYTRATRRSLVKAVAQSYRAGRRSAAAIEGSDANDIHELRKHVQIHWRHMRLLLNIWPDTMRARVKTAQTVSRLLGDHHDLEMLALWIGTLKTKSITPESRRMVLEFVKIRQKLLCRNAEPLVRLLYAERPSALAARMQAHWRASRKFRKNSSGNETNPGLRRRKMVKLAS